MVTLLLSSAVNPGNEPANWDVLSVGSETGPVTAPDAIAERLHKLYIDELLRSLMPPVHRMVDTRQTQALIRRARNGGPDVCEALDATTWIWSDLHLGHKASVEAFWRPFRTPHDMDKAMMDAWYEMVNVDDTIVCLGDVGVDGSVQPYHQRWWREAPGAKWLVLGNHDVDLDRNTLREAGFETLCQSGAVRHGPAAGTELLPATPSAGQRGEPARGQ